MKQGNTEPGARAARRRAGGRPAGNKATGPLRNFRLEASVDAFLAGEKERTGRDMVAILEHALFNLQAMKTVVRDAEWTAMRKRRSA